MSVLFWRGAGDQNFIKQLMNFDKDNISDRVLKKIGQYCAKPDFDPQIVGRVSSAAQSLCMWPQTPNPKPQTPNPKPRACLLI